MNTSLALTKKQILEKRSKALQKVRSFFYERDYLEVDCPLLSPFAALDNHIDLFKTATQTPYFLHSSPEYGMKKLLSLGAPSIFQLSHVFRENETGSKHAQEFMMLEFYKLETPYLDFIEETLQLVELFTGKKKRRFISYKQAFLTYVNLDPFHDLHLIAEMLEERLEIETYDMPRDDILSMAMAAFIEPMFNFDEFTIVTDFPQSQAALSNSYFDEEQNPVSFRFEIYHKHLELANGYQELKCPIELKKRFQRLNQLRLEQDKNFYPIDHELLEAMGQHFPDCCGVAVGFDRLFMIELGAHQIRDVLSLPSI